jgi:hypothetical protein
MMGAPLHDRGRSGIHARQPVARDLVGRRRVRVGGVVHAWWQKEEWGVTTGAKSEAGTCRSASPAAGCCAPGMTQGRTHEQHMG